MDEQGFREFLRKGGRSQSATERCVACLEKFEAYLQEHKGIEGLDKAGPQDLEDFVAWIESEPKTSTKTHLWAIRYYYEFTSDETMRRLASQLREQRIKKKPFGLNKFRGVNPKYTKKLAAIGIRNVNQMLEAGRTRAGRENLSKKTGIPPEAILEFVKLSDLARIPGIKGIRARLYLDAGVDTLEKMAKWNPQELREMLIEFAEQTEFNGIAPLQKEAEFSVEKSKELPKTIEY